MKVIHDSEEYQGDGLVASIGMFDGVHLGHQILINFLKEEAQKEGLQSAIVTFKEHPQQVLRPKTDLKMITSLDERLKEIECQGVDVGIVMNFTLSLAVLDSFDFMKLLRDRYNVKTLVIGYNHNFGHNRKETFKDYERNGKTLGINVVKAPEYHGEHSPVSSSVIRKLITSGKVDDAQDCLGRPFSLKGKVVHGKEHGREIGYPTANIEVEDEHLITPHRGAYVVRLEMEAGNEMGGMANIGVRPTIDDDNKQTFEVHLFDFDGDLYDKELEVKFIKFLRTEVKKDSMEELKEQLIADEAESRKILSMKK